MRNKKILIGVILVSVLVAASIFINGRLQAQSQGTDDGTILSKLDQILNNERALMDQISSMRQELNVIKIRVTQSQ